MEEQSDFDHDHMDVSDTIEEEDEEEEEVDEQNEEQPSKKKVYLPGQKLKSGEVLEPDASAYIMLHEAYAGTSCLSFDIIPDNLGNARETFPHTCYVIGGTQAERKNQNGLIVMKLSNLRKTHKEKENEDDSTDSSSSEEEEHADGHSINTKAPVMNSSTISHYGCVNRVRTCQYNNTMLAASWSELGRVSIWDLKKHLLAVENRSTVCARSAKKKSKTPLKNLEPGKPLYTFSGHLQEGYAMDWSSTVPGVLATGDCSSNIHLWSPREDTWDVDQRPLKSHTKSVEDLQWSPNENNVLASCSVDKSIKIWDIRAAPSKACMLSVEAHSSDVNVISWNRTEPLIVSGGDDGYLKVWDLRKFKEDTAVATFKHHTEPVTTVEWHPSDSSVFASGGEDNQIAIWDLSLERDNELSDEEIKEIPPQLLFIHLGQECIKELHWHPQIPGSIISTAQNGINIFKTISV